MRPIQTLRVFAIVACVWRNCFAAPTPPMVVDAAAAAAAAAAVTFPPGQQPSNPAALSSSDATAEPVAYQYTLSDVLSAVTAEFVFNVAGDHILFPVPGPPPEDVRLHATAAAVAQLFRRLHVCGRAYRVLNETAYDVVARERTAGGNANLVKSVLDQAVRKFADHPELQREYVDARQRLEKRRPSPPPYAEEHGRYASNGTRTLYDVAPEQLARAERLLEDARVKKLIMGVTFWKASEYEYDESMPRRVRDDVTLARAVFRLAEDAKLRPRLQRAFDETLEENVDGYNVMDSGDDQMVFETLRRKIAKDGTLSNALNALKMG